MSFGSVEGMSGVQTGPGATALTRTPLSIAIFDSAFEKFTIAALVGAYARSVGLGLNAWIEAVFRITLPGAILGSAARHSQNIA